MLRKRKLSLAAGVTAGTLTVAVVGLTALINSSSADAAAPPRPIPVSLARTGVAAALADYVSRATTSVHVAIYDFRLGAALAGPVVTAFTAAAARGVDVRIAYDHGKPAPQTALAFAAAGADPAPVGTDAWLHE